MVGYSSRLNPKKPGWLRRARLLCVLLFLLAAGCAAVGPDYKALEADTPEEWLDAQKQLITSDPIRPDWWGVFGDPELVSLVQEAFARNLTLRVAGLRVYESRASLGVAVGNLYPQSQAAEGSIQAVNPSDRAPTAPQPGSSGTYPAYNQASIDATASWELDFWGKFRRGVEAARAEVDASVADYHDARVSLAAQTAQTYLTLRIYQERLAIARANVVVQQEGLRIAQARYRYGATSDRDVQQAVTLLTSTQATIPSLENGLAQAEHALALLLGMTPGELHARLKIEQGIPDVPAEVAVGVPADLLRRRPDIRKAERLAAAQSARIGEAKADLYPSFTLSGTIGFLSSSVGAFELSDILSHGYTASGSAGLRWSLFNYGRITNAVRVQDAVYQELETQYENTVLSALREAEDSLSAFLRAREQAAFLDKSATAAARSVKLALFQYREGATDFTTVLTAQQNLLQQQDNLALARGAIVTNLAGLYRALGGGWEAPQGRDEAPLAVPVKVREEMKSRTDWGGLLDTDPEKPGGTPKTDWPSPDW